MAYSLIRPPSLDSGLDLTDFDGPQILTFLTRTYIAALVSNPLFVVETLMQVQKDGAGKTTKQVQSQKSSASMSPWVRVKIPIKFPSEKKSLQELNSHIFKTIE